MEDYNRLVKFTIGNRNGAQKCVKNRELTKYVRSITQKPEVESDCFGSLCMCTEVVCVKLSFFIS